MMEFDDGGDKNNNGMWEWRGDECNLQKDTQNEFSHLFWDEVGGGEDDLLCILDEHTPIKDCADLGHQISNFGDDAAKALECKESLQFKRRRTLLFSSDATEAANKQMASTFLEAELECPMMEHGISESLEFTSEWASDDRSAFNSKGLDQSSDGWLVECLNESEMNCSHDETHTIVGFNQQVDICEYYHDSSAMETDMVPETPALAKLKVFKGKKSYIRSPRKLTTSVAYPFALIKPCGVHGDVTLNDINQRLHAPLPSKLQHEKDEDPFIDYPTSAFSGKPVVVKTKIRTEGGQGSITITRTKVSSSEKEQRSESSGSLSSPTLTISRRFVFGFHSYEAIGRGGEVPFKLAAPATLPMAGASSLFFIRSLLIARFATESGHTLSVTPRSPRLPSLPLTRYSMPLLRLHVHGQHPPRSFISTKTAPEVDSSINSIAKTESHDLVVPEEMKDEEWRLFKLWMAKFNKTYEDNAEKMRRFEIFKGTVNYLKTTDRLFNFNLDPNGLPNVLADRSKEEKDQLCGLGPNPGRKFWRLTPRGGLRVNWRGKKALRKFCSG